MQSGSFPSKNSQLALVVTLLVLGSIVGVYIGFTGFSKYTILGIVGILLLILTIVRPWIAIVIFFLLIPLQHLFVLQAGYTATLSKLFGAYLVFLTIICGSFKYINYPFTNKKVLWILVYGIIALISVSFSRNTEYSLNSVVTLWMSIILYFVLVMMIRDLRTLTLAVIALLTGAVLSILSPLVLGFGRISGSVMDRYGGLWGDQNEFAAILLVLMPLCITFIIMTKRWLCKTLYSLYSLVLFFGFVFTYSRGGFLAFGVMITIAMFKIIRGKNRMKILTVAIPCFIIAFSIFYFTMADKFISRMETLSVLGSRESLRTESSLDMRYYFYFDLAPKLFIEHPFLGVGYRDLQSYNIYNTIAHNTYLEVLTGTGLVGFIPFMIILFLTWKDLRFLRKIVPKNETQRNIKTLGNALELGFIAYLLAGCFISIDIDKMLWLCIALSAVLMNLNRILFKNRASAVNKFYQPTYERGVR